jgi:hypothetical protein
MTNFWGIRLGKGGSLSDICRENNYIAIGWHDRGFESLTWLIKEDNDDAKRKLADLYKKTLGKTWGRTKKQQSKDVSQIYYFVKVMQDGDVVLSPTPRRTVLIGKVTGGVYWANHDKCKYRDRRKVEWLKEISLDKLSQPLRYSLGSLLTLFRIKGHDIELNSLIEGKPFTPTHNRRYDEKENEESVVGEVINFRGLVYSPINEQGVVFLFGKVSNELGITIEEIHQGFPDAKGRVKTGKGWAKRDIEFEYKSSNYDHLPKKCDIIVCWEHDWTECPKDIQVIELKKEIEELKKKDSQ